MIAMNYLHVKHTGKTSDFFSREVQMWQQQTRGELAAKLIGEERKTSYFVMPLLSPSIPLLCTASKVNLSLLFSQSSKRKQTAQDYRLCCTALPCHVSYRATVFLESLKLYKFALFLYFKQLQAGECLDRNNE